MDRARNQFFSRARFTKNKYGRICWRYLVNLRQHPTQRARRPNNLLGHRSPIDLLTQSERLVSDSLFSLLAIINVGGCHEPLGDLTLFIKQWLIPKQEPAKLPVFPKRPLFNL